MKTKKIGISCKSHVGGMKKMLIIDLKNDTTFEIFPSRSTLSMMENKNTKILNFSLFYEESVYDILKSINYKNLIVIIYDNMENIYSFRNMHISFTHIIGNKENDNNYIEIDLYN